MNDMIHLLSLMSVPGVGPYRIRSLVGHFQSPKAVLEADYQDLSRVEGIDEKTARNIRQKVDRKFAEDQLSRVEKHGAQLISFWDSKYPDVLKKIHDPPVLLYVKGSLDARENHRLAIVGTRTPSSYGRQIAERLGMDLSRRAVTVVSGIARGIDTAAHRGALKGGGRTVAVLGCGLDVIYPPENGRLYEQVSENGALISEFPMTAEPAGVHFPRRNRIISGLSLGTVVVEAGEKSGALITAYMALEQGREVFAVPGDVRSVKSRGTHKLIKEGAKLIEDVEDIFAEIPALNAHREDTEAKVDFSRLLTEDEMLVWRVLAAEPVHIDRIAVDAGVNTQEALALLLSMELKDCVKQLSGMMFVRR